MRTSRLWRVFGVVGAVFLAAAAARAQTEDCSVLGQTSFVRDTLQDIYFWYRELPDLDPALYDGPEAYLEAVRFRPLDASFSYITARETSDAYYSSSQFIGVGFSMKQQGKQDLRVSQVFPDSPASEAGLARGDFLVEVNRRPVSELLESGELGAELGPNELGYTIELTWHAPGGPQKRATVTKRPVTIPTVSQTKVFDLDGLPVGYVHLRNFVEPSTGALNEAFAELRARGVVDVILDLRYNGGGLIDVARHLGGLVGGARTSGRLFVELAHNDKNTHRNRALFFEDPEHTLDLPRLVVITTRASASSSELLINGLAPFIDVTIVGDRTFGKPVGQYGFTFCDKIVFPVSFENRNSEGASRFYEGLPADCVAEDELDRPLGDPTEASLAEAFHFLREGACTPREERALRAEAPVLRWSGFRSLLNAW